MDGLCTLGAMNLTNTILSINDYGDQFKKRPKGLTKHLLPTSVRLPNEPGLAAMSHTGGGNVLNSQEMRASNLWKQSGPF